MSDIEQRSHDLAMLYLKSEIESGNLEIPEVSDLNDFVGHYYALLNNFREELNSFPSENTKL